MRICGPGNRFDRLPPILPSSPLAGRWTAQAAAPNVLRDHGPGDAWVNALGTGGVATGQSVTMPGTSCVNSRIWFDLDQTIDETHHVVASHAPDPSAAADCPDWSGLYQTARQTYRPHLAARAARGLAGGLACVA